MNKYFVLFESQKNEKKQTIIGGQKVKKLIFVIL